MHIRDAQATKGRILASAVSEFAYHGYAGARVARIADAAQANKSMIYAYFGNKDQLFDAVIDAAVGGLHVAVPFTPEDLPGYGARLFDFIAAHMVEVRIDAWRRLERPAVTSLEREIFAEKIAALDELKAATGATFDSADLLVAVLALAWSWVAVPAALGSLASGDVATQRERVVQSIEALCSAIMEPRA
ncbi:MAG: AcrR family transcriptional regulator [Glaciecola sp.]|jgi:AcrR family transcriptional regulator